VILKNLDGLTVIGQIPDHFVTKIVTCCKPHQLLKIEQCNKLSIDTEPYWEKFCNINYQSKGKIKDTWKNTYLFFENERQKKFNESKKKIINAEKKLKSNREKSSTNIVKRGKEVHFSKPKSYVKKFGFSGGGMKRKAQGLWENSLDEAKKQTSSKRRRKN